MVTVLNQGDCPRFSNRLYTHFMVCVLGKCSKMFSQSNVRLSGLSGLVENGNRIWHNWNARTVKSVFRADVVVLQLWSFLAPFLGLCNTRRQPPIWKSLKVQVLSKLTSKQTELAIQLLIALVSRQPLLAKPSSYDGL